MTVFVVQKQMKFDDKTGELVPKFPGLCKAKQWGDLCYLLSPTASPFHPEGIIAELNEKLSAFKNDDFLLLIGNPALIGAASAIAARINGGRIKCLQWSGRHSNYVEIFFTLW